MPVLSIYFGVSEVSLLAVNTLNDYKFYNYPYFIKDETFIKGLIKLAAKELGYSFSGVPLICCGFPTVFASEQLGAASSLTLDKIFPKYPGITPVYVSNSTVISSAGFISAQNPSLIDKSTLSSYYASSVYPFIIHADNLDQLKADNLVRFYPPEIIFSENFKPIVFTGDRFSPVHKDTSVSYLLLLDLLKTPGVYEVEIDTKNALANLAMLNMYSPEYNQIIHDYKFDSIGTLINSPGATECLIENSDGTSQVIDVGANDIFIIPMEEAPPVRVFIKNNVLGSIEKKVRGGKLGLIIDTRSKNDPKVFNLKYFEDGFKYWEERIKEALCTYL